MKTPELIVTTIKYTFLFDDGHKQEYTISLLDSISALSEIEELVECGNIIDIVIHKEIME